MFDKRDIPESRSLSSPSSLALLAKWVVFCGVGYGRKLTRDRVCLVNLFFRPPPNRDAVLYPWISRIRNHETEGDRSEGHKGKTGQRAKQGEERRREKENPKKGIKEDGIVTI